MRPFKRSMRTINPGYGQFRWVVLLLGIAIILPTVCLLWFMNEVVKSERLIIRQKLTGVYRNKLQEATDEVDKQWADRCRQLERRPSVPFYRQFVSVVSQNGCDALIVYDEAGERLYPAI
jgi:hypothetical protein